MSNITRAASGKFSNNSPVRVSSGPKATKFKSLDVLDETFQTTIKGHLNTLIDAIGAPGSANPAVVVKASPGAGKSTATLSALKSCFDEGFAGPVTYFLPTNDLAAEACARALEEGIEAIALRGRSAFTLDGSQRMCCKHDIAEEVARRGLNVSKSLCERTLKNGETKRCTHFDTCPYQAQFNVHAQLRFQTTSTVTMPAPDEQKPALRIIDETFFEKLLIERVIARESFLAPREGFPAEQSEVHEELLAAAKTIWMALAAKDFSRIAKVGATKLRDFSIAEWNAKPPEPRLQPDQTAEQQMSLLTAAGPARGQASAFARFWRTLADAVEAGRERCERISMRADGSAVTVFGIKKLHGNAPTLILDADADAAILQAVGVNVIAQEQAILKPNAEVIQIGDKSFSTTSLLNSKTVREDCRAIIRREVREAKSGGVLVGATRKVVQRFFEDVGHDFAGMSTTEISRIMKATKVEGARWLWFGGAALGSNAYEDFERVVILGREELPVAALEDMGRCVFGDSKNGSALKFVETDDGGRLRLPTETVYYELKTGEHWTNDVPCHPDASIRRLQSQKREASLRQLVERLRLARSESPKRVVLCTQLPITGLPVDRLVSFEDFKPRRTNVAVLEGLFEHGAVRLSTSELSKDAGETFPTANAVKQHLKQHGLVAREEFERLSMWAKGLGCIVMTLRFESGGYAKPVVVHAANDDEALEKVRKLWGPCEVVRQRRTSRPQKRPA